MAQATASPLSDRGAAMQVVVAHETKFQALSSRNRNKQQPPSSTSGQNARHAVGRSTPSQRVDDKHTTTTTTTTTSSSATPKFTMPPAKRVKSSAAADARSSTAGSGRPTTDDLEGENEFANLARQHWLKSKRSASGKVKVKNDVLKREIWDALEKDNFPLKSLLMLEGLQALESYLWPGYGEDSSNYHVLLIVLIVNAKRRERLDAWGEFSFLSSMSQSKLIQGAHT